MKFIAERYGVIPRGKTMNYQSLENLYVRYKDTPIYTETLREVHQEKLDLDSVKEILANVTVGDISVVSKITEKPSPLARHILEKYADVEEFMESTITGEDQLDYMKKSIHSRKVNLACMNCGEWSIEERVREISERPICGNCGSGLLAVLRLYQKTDSFLELFNEMRNGEDLPDEEKEILTKGRKTADMVLSYGKKAIEALMVRGVGPITSYQILSRMHTIERDFFSDLLKAKIQYMKTRQYWDNK
jgi:ATP-dependent Lhr-like helicase